MIRTAALKKKKKPETLLTETTHKSDFVLFIYFSYNRCVLQINVLSPLLLIIILYTIKGYII